MANTSVPTAPGWPGGIDSPVPRRSPCAKRRRILGVVSFLVILGIAAAVNYGPVQTYRDARTRLDQAATSIEALETERAALQSELGKLTEAGYLESLAREGLTYARPGEDIYIVSGSEGEVTEAAESTSSVSAGRPGPFERFLSALGDLF
jgi:cell division protein FtsB